MFTGRRGEDSCGVLQNLDIFAEPVVLAAQLRQLQPLRASQPAAAAGPGVRPRLVGQRPDRCLDQGNILYHLGRGPILALAQLNDLSLELLANGRRLRVLFPVPKLHDQPQLSRDIARQLRRSAGAGCRGPGPLVIHTPGRPQTSSLAPARPAAARQPAAARYRSAATAPGRPQGYALCARSVQPVQPAAPVTGTPGAGAPAGAHRTSQA